MIYKVDIFYIFLFKCLRYGVFKVENVLLVILGVGLCSKSDLDYCFSYVILLDNVIFRIFNCFGDGLFVWFDGNVLILRNEIIFIWWRLKDISIDVI